MKIRQYNSIYFVLLGSVYLLSLINSCRKDENPPLIITLEAMNIGSSTALSGGTIAWEDASAVTDRGICWNTTSNPTIEDHKISNGTGTGSYKSIITGLSPNTSYCLKSYVIKNGRVFYGNLVSFKTKEVVIDIEGNIYNTITIGNQIWMAENLRTSRFRNGDTIGTTTPATLNTMNYPDPVYQWAYDGIEKNAAQYGRLYTWYTVMDPRGLSPEGWHIPSNKEWTELENYLTSNNYNYDGTNTGNKIALSLSSGLGWSYSEKTGTPGNISFADSRNISCFSALPSGYRNQQGIFVGMGISSSWWSSSEAYAYNAHSRYLFFTSKELSKSKFLEFSALSVRCIKDE